MLTFAAKLGFALHFESFGERVQEGGGVHPMWFSNVQALQGEIPPPLLAALPEERRTLKQGKKTVSDQFQYTLVLMEGENTGLFYAVFRESFAVAAITVDDRSIFGDTDADLSEIIKPGDLRAPEPSSIPDTEHA